MNNNTELQQSKLFETYSPFVFKVALLITRSRTLSDDITQETFIRIFKKIHLYDPLKPIEPWLYRITVNVTNNLLRKQKWLKFFGDVSIAKNSSSWEPESELLHYERDQELWESVGRLSVKYRQILVLHYYSEMSLNEISSILEIPLGTCKSRLNMALRKLRLELDLEKGGILDEI
ncbi:sigma-70 family RNA polymerase sigma factor [Paenibacillus qinlingensis]|uniref:RNA polymerase sigma factor n=1 Tax=Paenibacillus qinlingensis TaxID=1837343 RepID=A0ABU1NTX7_9BACL|nr:sigma-70 family RNA polymerase sigma factor [Paenibacillus qinlingensis]MDR6550935.1 RNA polymerase sigma-70 factor (ECF subfamily) [Paenibacillus qinlingensis]